MIKILFFFLFFLVTYPLKANEFNLRNIVDLNEPWGSTFINNQELLITEKSGKIKIINLKNKDIKAIDHNLKVLEYGQGGLLDILFKDNMVWVSYTEDRGNYKTSTSIARGNFNRDKINFKNIFQAYPPIDSPYHFGSRLAIQGKYLFASIGERGQGMIAQDSSKHPGSIIRIHIDGKIPKDNPKFIDKKDWLPEIYQIGVRNPQGLALSLSIKKFILATMVQKVETGLVK